MAVKAKENTDAWLREVVSDVQQLVWMLYAMNKGDKLPEENFFHLSETLYKIQRQIDNKLDAE
jgi:hypothetical protein